MSRSPAEWYRLDGNLWVLEDDSRDCTLSGIDCKTCGNVWGLVGCAYPTVSCDDLPAALRSDDGPVTPERYKEQRKAVIKTIGDERPVMPGTDFGPLIAPLRREPPRYWVEGFYLILQEEAAQDPAIQKLGLRTARFVSRTSRGKKSFPLFEVEAWPVAKRPNRIVRKRMQGAEPPCTVCGFQRTPSYEGEPVLASSLAGLHVARLDQAPGTLFVSAAFKDALTVHRTTPAVTFVPLEVVAE
jgi:hypothetical protein